MTKFEEDVYKYLRTIPKGKVVTYGQIARHLDKPKASRAVGNALHINPDPIGNPCFKVVNGQGHLAYNFGSKGGIDIQKKRLENDGVKVIDYKVDLNKYQYKPKLDDMSITELWYLFPIYLVPYKQIWNMQYTDEKNRLLKILKDCPIVSINHIGSTSLGIYSKDIVDIMIEIDDDLNKWFNLLIKNGYRNNI